MIKALLNIQTYFNWTADQISSFLSHSDPLFNSLLSSAINLISWMLQDALGTWTEMDHSTGGEGVSHEHP